MFGLKKSQIDYRHTYDIFKVFFKINYDKKLFSESKLLINAGSQISVLISE